jgi:RHS repeat-associated protein
VTPLPDGRQLVIGGVSAGRPVAAIRLWDPATGTVIPVGALGVARTGHSATRLPDGTFLVLGGTGFDGRPVGAVERVTPTGTGSTTMAALAWSPRAGHSATLLDGTQILLVGGLGGEAPVGDVERLDLAAWQVTPLGALGVPRAFHTASLRGDGRVEVWGGRGTDPLVGTTGALIDPVGLGVVETVARETDPALIWVTASDPGEGASDVGPDARLMLRLSRPARLDSVTPRTVLLASTAGPVAVEVVPAEQGRLVFVRPTTALDPETAYLLTLDGVRDTTHAAFPLLTLSFTTARRETGTPDPPTDPTDDELWDPARSGQLREWRSGRPDSPWQQLPRLLAPDGVTAVSGQVLRLNGSPLAGVTLRLSGRVTATDDTGRFLLIHERLATGWHELVIDGRTASTREATYGVFEVAVRVTAGQTTVLPYTSWLPRLDTAAAVRIPSPTATETVITTPRIPGLELRLAPGTVITDEDGRVVREVSITPIPVDRTPFPLPTGVDVPIYFTIQPGGAYVAVTGNGGTRGARLIYPNYRNLAAGTRMEFWNYEPEDGRGWHVYGEGAVSRDGQQVVPDPGVAIYTFTGAMVGPPSLAAALFPMLGDEGWDGDPVHLGTGLFVLRNTDLVVDDVLPLRVERTYRPVDSRSRSFGIGATQWYDTFLVGSTSPWTYIDLILPSGARVHYDRISPGGMWESAVYENTDSPTAFYKSRISFNLTGGGGAWNLDLTDGTRIVFADGINASRPQQAAIVRVQDRHGNAIVMTRDANANLTQVTSPNGRWIKFTYDGSYRATSATDNLGRTVSYTYDASGRLWKVTDVLGGVTEYTYDASHRLLTITDPRGIVYLTNQYDAGGRVTLQTQADSTTYQFAYTLDGTGAITQVDVTHPAGDVRRVTYGAARYLTSDTWALGQPEQQTTTVTRESGSNLLLSVTDALSRQTSYTYDTSGNVTAVTELAGTGNARTTSYTYEPTFQQVASVTDPLSRETVFTHDAFGNPVTIEDPLGHETTLTYNSAGQMTSITDALSQTTTFEYLTGDLVSQSDPLGRTTSSFFDTAGRPVTVTNPLGHVTRYTYNAKSQVTKVTDALDGETTFTYDPNGRVLTLTDAKGGTTTYTYNSMDRMATRTDPLSRAESFVYDANGNLQSVTDRKSQVTSHTYDKLDRLLTTTYADSSTTTHTYDAGDRLTSIVDSIAGTLSRSYDLLDRLTGETTPEGSISYAYDAADRQTSMNVTGQTAVTYGYDNADRMTSVTQGSSVVGLAYDAADRQTTLTLPNGIVMTSSYDAADQLTGLTYALGGSTLGTLTYAYDLTGNRTTVGGTWARTGLPAALASATYDAANQVTAWGGTSLTYDANGNLTNDGTRGYTWNARDELTALSGGVSASFAYDAAGRRRAKTAGGTTTSFLYDGLNLAQELTSGTPSANYLPGLRLDQIFTRADGAGTAQFLADALGSTVALTDGSGAVQTSYTYQPFGTSSTTGASTTNPMGFTGREDDGTGLLYYRARYYHPAMQRFVSEGPVRLAGDPNLYGYVGNSPPNFRDPTGLGQLAEELGYAEGLSYGDINVNLPLPLPGAVGTIGAMISNGGVYVYAGVGVGAASVSLTASSDSVSQGWNGQLQGSRGRATYAWGMDSAGHGFREGGVTFPSAGVGSWSATGYYVFPPMPWQGPPGWPGPFSLAWQTGLK